MTPETVVLTATHSEPEPGDLPTVTLALGGAFARIKLPCFPDRLKRVHKRGSIHTFSPAARKRLMECMCSIDRDAVKQMPLFVTLTYPKIWPAEMAECKAQLFAFCKRITRRFPHASIVWKLEYQSRGAPHFHLLLWNVPFLPLRQVARDWYEVVGSELAEHLAAGTRVERVRGWKGITYYVSKYLAKVVAEGAPGKPGRFWGVVNAADLPTRLLVCYVAWQTAYIMRRAAWRLLEKRGYKVLHKPSWAGLSLLVQTNDAIRLLELAHATGEPQYTYRKGPRCNY